MEYQRKKSIVEEGMAFLSAHAMLELATGKEYGHITTVNGSTVLYLTENPNCRRNDFIQMSVLDYLHYDGKGGFE